MEQKSLRQKKTIKCLMQQFLQTIQELRRENEEIF